MPVIAGECERPCRARCSSPHCNPPLRPPALTAFDPARPRPGPGVRASRRQVAGLLRACQPEVCLVEGCGLQPCCNFPGLTLRLYCDEHREAGMVPLE